MSASPAGVQPFLQLQWGWITPGTTESNRKDQSDDHLEFLRQPVLPRTRHLLFTHCGWWFDLRAGTQVRRLTADNPEPNRALTPCPSDVAQAIASYIRQGRLEYVLYPYAACVTEATSGEALLKTFRLSLRAIEDALGVRPRALLGHDYCYGLDWGTVQMPRIAALLQIGMVLCSTSGTLRGPDGSTCLSPVDSVQDQALTNLPRPHPRPLFLPLELHQNLGFHRRLADTPGLPLHALTLDEFLHDAPPQDRVLDTRVMGSKGWYGGILDTLVMEQFIKSTELRLPALQALATLHRSAADADRDAHTLDDLWKATLILMDNHALWQCHNYRAHWLPRCRELLEQAHELERRWLAGAGHSSATTLSVFNPSPWSRDLVVATERGTLHLPATPGWSVRRSDDAQLAAALPDDDDPYTLARGSARYRLDAAGRVVESSVAGRTRTWDGLCDLVRVHETPVHEKRSVAADQTVSGWEGSLTAVAQAPLPDGSTEGAGQPAQLTIAVDACVGDFFVLQVTWLDHHGRSLDSSWHPLRSMHWGGRGLPQHQHAISVAVSPPVSAEAVRVQLFGLAQGAFCLSALKLTAAGGCEQVERWEVTLLQRVTCHGCADTTAHVIVSDAARKVVRFTGTLPDCQYELDVTLGVDDPALKYEWRVTFATPTRLGLTSPPFLLEDGSMLGAGCERPYVPGLLVRLPLPESARRTRYHSDKPFYIQEAFQPSPRHWHTNARQDWWLGMSPFIGMNLATVQWQDSAGGDGQLGLLTRGLKHFFRWKRQGTESLALSLGATLIHPMTQGHTVVPASPLHSVAQRTTHDPYPQTPFLDAHGTYVFHWAICPAAAGDEARIDLWRLAQQFALPPLAHAARPAAGRDTAGFDVTPACVVISALEPRGPDATVLRLVNLSGAAVDAAVTLPAGWKPARAPLARLGPHAIVEWPLQRV